MSLSLDARQKWLKTNAIARASNCTYHSFNSKAEFALIIGTKAASESTTTVIGKQLGPEVQVSHPGDCCAPSVLLFK